MVTFVMFTSTIWWTLPKNSCNGCAEKALPHHFTFSTHEGQVGMRTGTKFQKPLICKELQMSVSCFQSGSERWVETLDVIFQTLDSVSRFGNLVHYEITRLQEQESERMRQNISVLGKDQYFCTAVDNSDFKKPRVVWNGAILTLKIDSKLGFYEDLENNSISCVWRLHPKIN